MLTHVQPHNSHLRPRHRSVHRLCNLERQIQIRGPFLVVNILAVIAGYILLITYANPVAALVGCFFVGGCIFTDC